VCINPSGITFLLTDSWGGPPEIGIPAHGCDCGFSATGTERPCPGRGGSKEGEEENLVARRCVTAHHK
jgi:hypothetical protein